ncbi:uncharacterized protein LOC108096098 isoform X1 [Drosophila ficusphila]|uniref:uncharacterized protein LOC108096098 isoform X1 n=1 Tax=Drosophila ficusphila TaxID=30025 RepID=UPI001C8AC023|nr:uncharacterized protein LOC108096098 isoform X1 [Drosophila ficusphila]
MDRDNKYRKELREHFYGSKYPSPLKENNKHGQFGHREVDGRLHVERTSPTETIPQTCKRTIPVEKHQAKPENHFDHLRYQRQDHHCAINCGHRILGVQDPLSNKYCHGYCQQLNYNKQSPRQLTNSRVVKEPNKQSPQAPDFQIPFNEQGGGDSFFYKNPTFKAPPSSGSDHGSGEGGEKKVKARCIHVPHKKEPYNYLEAVKAQCEAVGNRFKQQYPLSGNDLSSRDSKSKAFQTTVISSKSGDDLRAAVRSQIELQEALDEFDVEVKVKKEQILSGGKNKPKKSLDSKPNSHPEEEDAIPAEPLSTRTTSEDLDIMEVVDLGISADDIVSTKVIQPIVRKIQRMYLNTLKEEMQIIDYLGKMPKLVSDVYKREAAEKKPKKA